MSRDLKLEFSPKLENLATKPITLSNLPLRKWINIPTVENEAGHHGIINYISLITGKNICIDLICNCEIECRDRDQYDKGDYIEINPVFNSENLEVISPNHYKFKTNLIGNRNLLQTLGDAKASIPKSIRNKYLSDQRPANVPFLKNINDADMLSNVLDNLYNIIDESIDHGERLEGYNNFRVLLNEFLNTGRITGHCKAVSTFTCGLLDGIGLPARKVGGLVVYDAGKKKEYILHAWAELYVDGFWLPFDAATGLKSYPSPTARCYYTCSTDLPRFSDSSVKEAKIRIDYVDD